MSNEIETRKLGFKYGGVVYLSDSFACLKDKVLELGAHRVSGVPGTGVDIRRIIETVDREALEALALDYPLEYIDPISDTPAEELDELTEKLEESVEKQAELYRPEPGDLVNVVRGPHAGHTGVVGSTDLRWEFVVVDAQGEAKTVTAKELQLVIRGGGLDELSVKDLLTAVHELTADLAGDFPATGEEVAQATKDLGEGGDVDGLRELFKLLQAEHDAPSERRHIRALDRFLLNQQDERRLREVLEQAEAERLEKAQASPQWIGAATEDPAITAQAGELTESAQRLCHQAGVDASREQIRPAVREELANNVCHAERGPVEASGYAEGDEVRCTKLWPGTLGVVTEVTPDHVEGREQIYVRDEAGGRSGIFFADELEHFRHPFNPDWDVTAPLPSFRFLTRLDANRRALLGDAIAQAVLEEGRSIVVSPALNSEVNGLYVTDQGWEELEDEA